MQTRTRAEPVTMEQQLPIAVSDLFHSELDRQISRELHCGWFNYGGWRREGIEQHNGACNKACNQTAAKFHMDEPGGAICNRIRRPLTVHTTFTLTLSLGPRRARYSTGNVGPMPVPAPELVLLAGTPTRTSEARATKSPFKRRQSDATPASRQCTERGSEGRHTFSTRQVRSDQIRLH